MLLHLKLIDFHFPTLMLADFFLKTINPGSILSDGM